MNLFEWDPDKGICNWKGCYETEFAKGFCLYHCQIIEADFRKVDTFFGFMVRINCDGPPPREDSRAAGMTNCWNWLGKTNSETGHGQFWDKNNRAKGAHRYAYEFFTGEIPDGYVVDHLCHNRICVNPEHLRACTPAENNKYTLPGSSNKIWTARPRKENQCSRGHMVEGDGAFLKPDGSYGCVRCREYKQIQKAKKKAQANSA